MRCNKLKFNCIAAFIQLLISSLVLKTDCSVIESQRVSNFSYDTSNNESKLESPKLNKGSNFTNSKSRNERNVDFESELMDALKKDEVDLEKTDSEGNSYFHLSVINKCSNCINQLLTKSADPNVKNHAGETALELARNLQIIEPDNTAINTIIQILEEKSTLVCKIVTLHDENINSNSFNNINLVENSLRLVNIGLKELGKHDNSKDEIILILGNDKFENDQLIRAITSEPSELFVASLLNKTFVIFDESGQNNTREETPIPNVFVDYETKTKFYSIPEFKNSFENIPVQFFLKNILDNAKAVKFLITISHASLKEGEDFENLLNSVTRLIPNIKIYSEGISLVVTNVESLNSKGELIDDKDLYLTISDLLTKFKTTKVQKSDNNSTIIPLIDILLEKDLSGSFLNLGISKSLNKCGPFVNSPVLLQSRQMLRDLVFNQIKFLPIEASDFSYSFSDALDKEIQDLFETTMSKIRLGLESWFKFALEKYKTDIEEVEGIQAKLKMLNTNDLELNQLRRDLKNVQNLKQLLTTLEEFYFNVSSQSEILDLIRSLTKLLEFLTEVSKITDPNESFWKEPVNKFLNFLDNLNNWYSFLTETYETVSSYKIQSEKNSNQYELRAFKPDEILSYYNSTLLSELPGYANVQFFKVSKEMYSEVNVILSHTLNSGVSYNFVSNGILRVEGNFILINEILPSFIDREESVEIFAFDTIYIDADIDLSGTGRDLVIIAPKWVIVQGERFINLNGKSGESYFNVSAKNSASNTDSGESGLSGEIGGNAGNFYGFGEIFVDSDKLLILSNGGAGGSGMNGGAGFDGQENLLFPNVLNISEVVTEQVEPPDNTFYVLLRMYTTRKSDVEIPWKNGIYLQEKWSSKTKNATDTYQDLFQDYETNRSYDHERSDRGFYWDIFQFFGQESWSGTDGGDAGLGAEGGLPGRVFISSQSLIKVSSKNGDDGIPGKGGRGGKPGHLNGLSVVCKLEKWWLFEYITDVICDNPNRDNFIPGKDGSAGGFIKQLENSNQKQSSINEYRNATNYILSFLTQYQGNYLTSQLVLEMILNVDKDNSRERLFSTHDLWTDLTNIEKLHYSLPHKFLIPLYESLIQKILGNVANSEKPIGLAYLFTITSIRLHEVRNKEQESVDIDIVLKNIASDINYEIADVELLSFFDLVRNIILDVEKDISHKSIEEIIQTLRNSVQWVSFRSEAYKLLSSYEIQSKEIANYAKEIPEFSPEMNFEYYKLEFFVQVPGYRDIAGMKVSQQIFKDLNALIDHSLKSEILVATTDQVIQIKGNFILISKILPNITIEQSKSVEIFAFDTIYIDADITLLEGKDLTIISPKWIIKGKRYIQLNGTIGESYGELKAVKSSSNANSGFNGRSGEFGGDAGNFLGFGDIFINAENLHILSQGGRGGSGENGGDGFDGKIGGIVDIDIWTTNNTVVPVDHRDEIIRRDNPVIYSKYTKTEATNEKTPCLRNGKLYRRNYSFFGSEGWEGTNAGDGGQGGGGGNPGFVFLSRASQSANHISANGHDGLPGHGGIGGSPGSEAQEVTCILINCRGYRTHRFSNCIKHISEIIVGLDGIQGTITIKPTNFISEPAKNAYLRLTRYKISLLENISDDSLNMEEIFKFLESIDFDSKRLELFTTFELCTELMEIDKANSGSSKLGRVIYSNLLSKINSYAIHPNPSETNEEFRNILNSLSTVVYNRLNGNGVGSDLLKCL